MTNHFSAQEITRKFRRERSTFQEAAPDHYKKLMFSRSCTQIDARNCDDSVSKIGANLIFIGLFYALPMARNSS